MPCTAAMHVVGVNLDGYANKGGRVLVLSETRRAALALLVLGAFGLAGTAPATATGLTGGLPAAPARAESPLLPAHATIGEAVPDADAAMKLAGHMVEDLIAEKSIAADWGAAKPVSADRRRLTRRSPFHVWVVRFTASADIDGKGTDLFIVVSDEGEFLKYDYKEP